MARKQPNRVVRIVSDVMWKRDQLQMRVVDALLSRAGRRGKRTTASGRKRATPGKR